jgi:hypothetical protein
MTISSSLSISPNAYQIPLTNLKSNQDNDELLQYYGFVEADNPHDSVAIGATIAAALSSGGAAAAAAPGGAGVAAARVAALAAAGIMADLEQARPRGRLQN